MLKSEAKTLMLSEFILDPMQAENKISLLIPKQLSEDFLKQWSDLLLIKIHHTHNRKNKVNNLTIA